MELDDTEFVLQFENGSLPPALFDHLGHLRMAWIYLQRYGEDRAIEKACGGIRAFARHHGDADKFHKTLTVASIKIVNHFVQGSSADHFSNFIRENPGLGHSFKELVERHYSGSLLGSKKARGEYLPPDLLPFDPPRSMP